MLLSYIKIRKSVYLNLIGRTQVTEPVSQKATVSCCLFEGLIRPHMQSCFSASDATSHLKMTNHFEPNDIPSGKKKNGDWGAVTGAQVVTASQVYKVSGVGH